MQISEAYINPEIDAQDALVHIRAAETWLNASVAVAKQTGNEYAASLVSTYIVNAAVCKPAEQGLIAIQGPEVPRIFVIPILSGEEDFSAVTKLLTLDKSQSAHFTENKPGRIYFDGMMKISETWRGLVLLHELAHADNYETSKYPSDHSEHWEEEVDVFTFEHQLLGILGGEGYKAYIGNQLKRLIDEHKKSGEMVFLPINDMGMLDEIFGKALSADEVKTRTSVVFLDILFKMIEEVYPVTANKDKVTLLRQSTTTVAP